MSPRALCGVVALWVGVATAGCLKVPGEAPSEPAGETVAPASVADVLDRHIAALGGEEALRKIEQRTIEARMIFHPEDGCEEGDETCMYEEQQGSFLFQNTADGRLYRRSVLGNEVEERGFDGKRGWVMLGGRSLRVDSKEEAVISAEDAQLHWYFDPHDRGIETTLLRPREQDSDGGPRILDGVRWKQPEVDNVKDLWFDRATGLLREEVSTDGEGEQRQSQTVIYEDYKPVDGVLVPHEIRVVNRLGDRAQTVEFVTQKVRHEPIEQQKYAVPELPPPEKKPDPLLERLSAVRQDAEQAPKDVAAQIELARTAFVAGHFDEAAEAAKATLRLDPKEPEALWILARVHLMAGRYDEARTTITKAGKAGVREGVVARELGWIHLRKRDFGKLARSLDAAGNPSLAGRYRSFVGEPLEPSVPAGACEIEVPLRSADPLLVLDVTVGDRTVAAILDTGAADVILTEKLAAELDVTVQARSAIAPGLPEVGHGQMNMFGVGGLTLSNVPINVFDDASIAEMAGEHKGQVQAVIGLATLSDFLVSVDPGQMKMTLVAGGPKCKAVRQALRKGPSVPVWLHESHYLYVMAELNGAEGIYLLNTGMRGADLTANPHAFSYGGVGSPVLRSDEASMVNVDTVTLGDAMTVKDVKAAWGYFDQSQTSDGFRLDGMLGAGVLAKQPFVVDYEKHRIYFPPAG